MRHWIGDPIPPFSEHTSKEEEEWEKGVDLTNLLERFQKVREKQVEIVNEIRNEHWNEQRLEYSGHGKVSAAWLVAKTIQHTFDHGDKLLRKALYWDDALKFLDKKNT